MSQPLSQDIRQRFLELYREGHSARSIGQKLMISAATAVRLAATLRGGGDLTPKPNLRRTGNGRLVPYSSFFSELVEQDPDITLKELQGALWDAYGVQGSISGIDSLLRRLGFTYKKRASLRLNETNHT